MYATVFNTTDTSVVVDFEGRAIGARDWGTVETTEDLVKDALDAGDLVKVAAVGADSARGARAVDAVTQAATERAGRLSALDAAQLAELAGDGYADYTKTQLVHSLALRPDVEIPDAAAPAQAEDEPAKTATKKTKEGS